MEFPSLAQRKVFVKKGGGGWNRSSTHVVCISWPETVIFRSLPCVDRNMRLRYILFKSFSVRVTARVGRNDLIFQSRWVSRKVLAWRKDLGTFQEFIASEIYMAWLLLIVTEILTSEALVLIVFCIQVSFTGS